MKILELILHRYTRLAFSAIETIHYKPTESTQIIIGTNGCGKSSFLSELNPLPTNKAFMLDGGYKTVRIEHRGKEYTLHSTYGKHHKNSFIEHDTPDGDKELNDGGTAAAQKILIEKVFGLNIELLKIWLGIVKFTDLPPIKRRDWILRLSGSDLDYAMTVFQKTRTEARDAQALEKHFVARLAAETVDIADQNRIGELEKSVALLTTDLNGLLEQRDTRIPSVAVIKNEMSRLLDEFHNCTNEILSKPLHKPTFLPADVSNIETLKHYVSNQITRAEMLESQLNEVYEQKKNINTALETLTLNGVNSLKELEEIPKAIQLEINTLIADTPVYDLVKDIDPNQLMGQYQACKTLLIETLSSMVDNSEGYFSQDKFNRANQKVVQLSNRIESAKHRALEIKHYLEHYRNARDETCPKCDHQFKPGMQGFDAETAEKEMLALHDQIKKDTDALTKGKAYCEEATEYRQQVKSLQRVMYDNGALEPLWKLLLQEDLYKVHPQSHIPTIHRFSSYLENCINIKQLQEQLVLNEAVLNSMKSKSDTENNYTDQHLKYLDQKIDEMIRDISGVKQLITDAKAYYREVSRVQSLGTRALEIHGILAEKYELLIRSAVNKSLSDVIAGKQVRLAEMNNALTKITRHDAVIQEVRQQKEIASENLKNFNVLLKTLSPVEGLISKYIQNFLDVFIEDVNIVIGDIWTSDMEVLSCSVDSSDVTCKFPLSINSGYFISPDIADTSSGQKDVINFAFRMVLAQYLDLADYPLYLDELAPTLDEQHRENITRYVNNLMESNQFEQMFMISHYAANHYAFANSEILMMDGRNIINKPGQFNKHVKIVRSNDILPENMKKSA